MRRKRQTPVTWLHRDDVTWMRRLRPGEVEHKEMVEDQVEEDEAETAKDGAEEAEGEADRMVEEGEHNETMMHPRKNRNTNWGISQRNLR